MRIWTKAAVLTLSLASVGGAIGCSSDDESGSGSSAAAVGCAADARKDVYAPGLSRAAGDLTVRLVEATPAPPAKLANALTLEVRDASGSPVEGATITVTPFMPDHGHGSSVTPVVVASGGGRYVVTKLYFAMAGLWRLTIAVQRGAGEPAREAAFQFCLDG